MILRAGARSVLRAGPRPLRGLVQARGLALALGLASGATVSLVSPFVSEAQAQENRAPTPDEMRQAGAAYDRAVAARAAGDFSQAATLYETADRLAPSAQALGNAVRAHREANTPAHNARAATLALRMIVRLADRPPLVTYATGVINELSPGLTRVDVQCQGCSLTVDQHIALYNEFFVEPGMHTVVAGWSDNRVRSHAFTARPGGTENVRLSPPDATPAVTPPGPGTGPGTGPGPGGETTGPEIGPGVVTPPPSRGGIPIPATVAALGVTAVLGGVLIWSGLDTLAGVPAYMNNPTPMALADGQGRELRTNVLIGAVSVAGAATVVMAIFTRRGGSSSSSSQVEVVPGAPAAGSSASLPGLTLRGSF